MEGAVPNAGISWWISVTDREMLEYLALHFVLLHRLAASPGPVLCNGERMGKWIAVTRECDAAREAILRHLKTGKSEKKGRNGPKTSESTRIQANRRLTKAHTNDQ
jgi:hypothetical protein